MGMVCVVGKDTSVPRRARIAALEFIDRIVYLIWYDIGNFDTTDISRVMLNVDFAIKSHLIQ